MSRIGRFATTQDFRYRLVTSRSGRFDFFDHEGRRTFSQRKTSAIAAEWNATAPSPSIGARSDAYTRIASQASIMGLVNGASTPQTTAARHIPARMSRTADATATPDEAQAIAYVRSGTRIPYRIAISAATPLCKPRTTVEG